MSLSTSNSLKVFISYSHRDEEIKDGLLVHLESLRRQDKIQVWQDRNIEGGIERDSAIKEQLASADIILLLVTANFIASEYCYDKEMQHALQRHEKGISRVIPIILKPCNWQDSAFSKLHVLPKDTKPVTQWNDQDAAFLNIIQNLCEVVKSLQIEKTTQRKLNYQQSFLPPKFSTYNPKTFTGRKDETQKLTTLFKEGCRVVTIVGMTGIGKTALAERVIDNLTDKADVASLPYYRFSLDDNNITPEFSSSGAALLRELGEELTLEDQKEPKNLVTHILTHLSSHPCRVQIDSLELLLRGNDQESWSEFYDPLWLELLQRFLSSTACLSQLLLTSQDIPADLDTIASRYPEFWHCESLQGLSIDEQQNLFQKLGLLFNKEAIETDRNYLRHIGQFYDGHPLVLQVIVEEIRQPPFSGNIRLYRQHYGLEFTDNPVPTNKLARSRFFRRRVRQRVEQTLKRLPPNAYKMLCANAVFRRPVSAEFWYAMVPDDNDAQATLNALEDRHLVEYDLTANNSLLLRQHNLIRVLAYNQLASDAEAWEVAERRAAHLWLNNYKPAPDASNLEILRGFLEASEHYFHVRAHQEIIKLSSKSLETGNTIIAEMLTWGYFSEKISFAEKLLHSSRRVNSYENEALALFDLGRANYFLGDTNSGISYLNQQLSISKKHNYIQGQRLALNDLGMIHRDLGMYEKAIEYHQQSLSIALRTELFDTSQTAYDFGNIGIAYRGLGAYQQAIEYLERSLEAISEGDKRGIADILIGLGVTYYFLGDFEKANQNLQKASMIVNEIDYQLGRIDILQGLGSLEYACQNYELAINYFQQSLQLSKEMSIRQSEGKALASLGKTYLSIDNFAQAIEFLSQSLAISKQIGDLAGEGLALMHIGKTKFKLGYYSESLINNQTALGIFQKINNNANKAKVLKNLAELHQALDEKKLALQYGYQASSLAKELGIPLQEECQNLLKQLESS